MEREQVGDLRCVMGQGSGGKCGVFTDEVSYAPTCMKHISEPRLYSRLTLNLTANPKSSG